MRVCIVSPNIVSYFEAERGLQYGGAEVQAAVLAEALRNAGRDVVLVTTDLSSDTQLPFEAVNAFQSTQGLPGLRFFHPRATGLLSAMKRANADVYYQRNAGMITGLVAWFCERHKRTFVYGAGSDADFSRERVLIDGVRDRTMYFYGVRRAHGVVVQNEAQSATCRQLLGRAPNVIPNAIRTIDQAIERDGSIVWVGHLSRVKQPEMFVELARRLPDREFVMIGGPIESEVDFAATVESEARSVANLTATGRIGQTEAMSYIGRAAMLVNTSSFEGFPNTFLEAWSRRTPVLSFVDVDDLVVASGSGAVCGSLDELVRRVNELADDSSGRQAMGESGLRLVEERFGADRLVERYIEYFDRLLKGATC